MYIKNRRNCNNIKTLSSYQNWCLTESLMIRNRLLFIYEPLAVMRPEKPVQQTKSVFFDNQQFSPIV